MPLPIISAFKLNKTLIIYGTTETIPATLPNTIHPAKTTPIYRYIGVVLAGCIVLGSVAGIVSVVPYMMRVLFSLNADIIGSGIMPQLKTRKKCPPLNKRHDTAIYIQRTSQC